MSTEKSNSIEVLTKRLKLVSHGSPADKMFATLTLINFLVVYLRPQNDLKVLESIKFPFIISLLPAFATLVRINIPWSKQLKMIGLLMLQGAILVPLSVNSFWAFQGVRALFQMSYGLAFPVAFFFGNGRNLKRLFKIMFLCGGYIAFYCLTHSGHGPGDFLGDENDACLVLVSLVAPALFFFTSRNAGLSKIILAFLIMLMLGGIVAASSRGGFLGLLCVGAYIFYHSRQKVAMIAAMFVIGIAGLFFVPKAYWEDIGTISTTDATAVERFTYWGVSWKMFLDPPNFVAGVGMMNFPWRSGDYEALENKGPNGKSMAGRQVHSLYFEALPELGIIGCYFLLAAIWASLKPNVRLVKKIRSEIRRQNTKNQKKSDGRGAFKKSLIQEGEFVQLSLIAVNSCFIGTLAGGAFISVLYYPTIWFLLGLSTATQSYAKKWIALSESVEFEVEDHFDKRLASQAPQMLL